MVPTQNHRIYHNPPYNVSNPVNITTWVKVSRHAFRCGLRFPLNVLLKYVLNDAGTSDN